LLREKLQVQKQDLDRQLSKKSPRSVDISRGSGKIASVAARAVRIKLKKGESMRTQKPAVELEDWAVVPSLRNGKYDELRPGNLLVGRAYGHQRIQSGTFIFSSPIVEVDLHSNVAETKNTSYHLGEASHEYKSWSQEHSRSAA
jgi:hypothetical protein